MSVPTEVARLADRIGKAVALPHARMKAMIEAALADAIRSPVWLPMERRRASHENYARHLLYGDPQDRFSILSIVWDHGQSSPIHGHYCWCAVGIYSGMLTETQYREASGTAAATGTRQRGSGTISFESAQEGIHRFANDSGAVAISLHAYGIAPDRISTGVNQLF